MTTTHCLNCNKELTDKFCPGCGQKADTHRITFRNFIFHDLMHGTFHIDKGMLFTARQSLMRPGKAALEYISGKRKRYYNVFYLILITFGLMLFFRHMGDLFYDYPETPADTAHFNAASRQANAIIDKQGKFITLLFVPFAALNSFILFRRKKLNLSEHAIVSGMVLLGILLWSTFGNIFFYFHRLFFLSDMAASILVAAVIFAYVAYGYANAFGGDYTKWGTALRILLFFGLIFLELVALTFLLIGYVTNWKMGSVTLQPF